MLIVRDTRKRWTDVLQKLMEDKVALQRRRDILKRTVQDLGSQYEALKTQLSENETYVQVVIDVIDLIELLPLPQVAYVDVHLKFIIYTVSQKKGATLTMAITLSVLDRCAKFFHCCKEQ